MLYVCRVEVELVVAAENEEFAKQRASENLVGHYQDHAFCSDDFTARAVESAKDVPCWLLDSWPYGPEEYVKKRSTQQILDGDGDDFAEEMARRRAKEQNLDLWE